MTTSLLVAFLIAAEDERDVLQYKCTTEYVATRVPTAAALLPKMLSGGRENAIASSALARALEAVAFPVSCSTPLPIALWLQSIDS